MEVILMAIATVVSVFFVFLYATAGENIPDIQLQSLLESTDEKYKTLQIQVSLLQKDIEEHDYSKKVAKKMNNRLKKLQKDIVQCETNLKSYEDGKMNLFETIPFAGYRAIQMLHMDGTNASMKSIIKKCSQFLEHQQAINLAYYAMASLIGYVIFGIAAACAVAAIMISQDMGQRALIIALVVGVLLFVLGYVPMNEIDTTVKSRQESIDQEFPQVISKLALLTEAGMEVNQAWNITCGSGQGVLYEEMNRVTISLQNNEEPGKAYSSFINRCSNKYTSKLASLIIQNMYKGNSEIVRQFSNLNTECWNEFRNNAARMGEKISTKLFVPTILMFVGILLMLIVPIMSSFGGM